MRVAGGNGLSFCMVLFRAALDTEELVFPNQRAALSTADL